MPLVPSDPTGQPPVELSGGVTPARKRFASRLTPVPYPSRYPATPVRQEDHERRGLLARMRARATLESILSAENRQRLNDRNYVVVTGSAGSEFRVELGYSGNVVRTWLDKRRGECHRQRLCAHPEMSTVDGYLPIEDAMIAQILMIVVDEDLFLSIALDY